MRIWQNTLEILRMIKFEHTVFALPFAYLGAFVAARGLPSRDQLVWISLAMFGARSGAMCFNRLVDAPFDALNPRTRMRSLPAGRLSPRFVIAFTILSLGIMLYSAFRLNWLCFLLAPVAVVIIFFYSFTKRFTSLSHFLLGLSLAIAPLGGWIATTGRLEPLALLLGLIVGLWVSGFDIIYACQDVAFDFQHQLHSLPQAIGVGPALVVSATAHLLMMILLFELYWRLRLSALSLTGILASLVLIGYEHWIVRPSDLSRINTAFFTLNGIVSVLLFLAIGIDLSLLR
ncbi:MAG TPA: UbiA-like polyprenyltransferase [Acidobacteriota bacterium]|jgi:4-hydroxybenzoate polyprenyltransferase|nr:UbiA-like polyprenyltransferase [Acidobacteriota bacterium]